MAKVRKPRITIREPEEIKYTIDNPNPEWEKKGEEWIKFALCGWKYGSYHVAYIPHVAIIIEGESSDIAPTQWDLEEVKYGCNFYMGGGNNWFRLNARRTYPLNQKKGCKLMMLASKKNIDLNPVSDNEKILDLLKIAYVIYSPSQKED